MGDCCTTRELVLGILPSVIHSFAKLESYSNAGQAIKIGVINLGPVTGSGNTVFGGGIDGSAVGDQIDSGGTDKDAFHEDLPMFLRITL